LYGSADKQADKPAAQIRLARADIEARQAELLGIGLVTGLFNSADK
jgi:hypothetical protein